MDLNAIPASAIERIEVLRDGAAAQYGSDAIAGVINIVLKSGVSPLTVACKAGTVATSYTDMQDAGRVRVGRRAARRAARPTASTIGRGTVDRDRGVPQPEPHEPRRPRTCATRSGRGDALNNPVAQPNHHWGDSDERDVLTFANLNYPIGGDQTFLYGFGGWSQRDGSHGGFYRRALDARNWPQIYPLGFLPTIEPTGHRFLGHGRDPRRPGRAGSGTCPGNSGTTGSTSTWWTA